MRYGTPLKAWSRMVFVGLALASASAADAFIYTVGQSGAGNNCSFPTAQQAINAAAATPEDDEIWITRDVGGGYYQNQALAVPNLRGKLTIVGGFDNCRDVTPEGVTELHGNGGAQASVLYIDAYNSNALPNNVILKNLRFTRGDASSSGGGVSWFGAGTLLIEDSVIDRNETRFGGGGLSVRAYGGPVTLTVRRTQIHDNRADTLGGGIALGSYNPAFAQWVTARFDDDVQIDRNYAPDGGGGLYVGGWVALDALGTGFRMERNGTLGDGGAILVDRRPANIAISPTGVAGSAGTFIGNEARNGGAIAVSEVAGSTPAGGNIRLSLGSRFYTSPQVFAANRAHEYGGAIYVYRPRSEGPLDGATTVCSFNAGYAGNDAAFGGSAVSAVGGSAFFRNRAEGAGCYLPVTPCSHLSCNQYSGHTATLDNGQPSTGGSLFEARYAATIDLFGARIAYNTVPWLFKAFSSTSSESPAVIGVDTALIYRNTAKSVASTSCDGTTCQFDMVASTVVGNTLSQAVFTNSPHRFSVRESIIDEPGRSLFLQDPTGTGSTLSHLVYTSNYSSGSPTVRQGDPGFMNVATMDYRLSGNSQAIDNLPAREGSHESYDFVGRARNVDVPWLLDIEGPRDLGAVETQLWEVSDVILRNGFD